ncbi:metallophosphoesterase [Psychromonas hadalis]|uniref:metallophosphoesterase n=1 Tax=Psychromonas hadalis TaxID=211669 RepID=UPI0003B7443C|nr:metallophosphoesterase [Psychromonas hadalis]
MQFKPRKQHIYNDANEMGSDFVVGDLHGEVEQLYQQLSALNFDYQIDRLFCTGDLISRGANTIGCLNLLTKKWFYPVLGNHEQLFLLGFSSPKYWDLLKENKGQWLTENLHQFDLLIRWKTLIEICMPLSRTITVKDKKVGITHASAITNWQKVQTGILSKHDIWETLWSRPLQDNKDCLAIDSIDCVVHGHSPVQAITKINNRYWIDTFSSTCELTIINLTALN